MTFFKMFEAVIFVGCRLHKTGLTHKLFPHFLSLGRDNIEGYVWSLFTAVCISAANLTIGGLLMFYTVELFKKWKPGNKTRAGECEGELQHNMFTTG